jgi:hypothetical protein
MDELRFRTLDSDMVDLAHDARRHPCFSVRHPVLSQCFAFASS